MQHGQPLALYHDRHGIFKQISKATEADTLEEQLAGKQAPTQFGRRYGRTRDHFDCRPLATSQRAGGTAFWHLTRATSGAPAPRWGEHLGAGQSGRGERVFRASTCSLRSSLLRRAVPTVPCNRGCKQRSSFASSIHAPWRQTTPLVLPGSVCNCCLMRSVAAMPGRASRCTSTSMGICRFTMPDAAWQHLKHRWRLLRCVLAQGRGAATKRRSAPQPQAQPWCSSTKLPRLSLGSRMSVQEISQLRLDGQLLLIPGASL